MSRKRKPRPALPPPARNAAMINARRTEVWRLMLRGVTRNDLLLKHLAEHKPPYKISVDTLIDDKHALDAAATKFYEGERGHLTARYLAKLDHVQMELEAAADAATLERDQRTKVAALTAVRQTVMDAGKLAGVVVEKQEVTGQMTNWNAEIDPKEVSAVKRAIKAAKINEDGEPQDVGA